MGWYLQLYTDLILADFLVSHTPFVGQVVFQYVSDLKLSCPCDTDFCVIAQRRSRGLSLIRCPTTLRECLASRLESPV